MSTTRNPTRAPSPNSKICNGCTVLVTGGPLKGKTGVAWMFVEPMWSVRIKGGETVSLHRVQLKRVSETATEVQVAA